MIQETTIRVIKGDARSLGFKVWGVFRGRRSGGPTRQVESGDIDIQNWSTACWVTVRDLISSYHNKASVLFAIYPYYGNLI